MNSGPAPVRLAIAGAYLIGCPHLARIEATARCELVALVDPAHDPLVTQFAHLCDVIRCRSAPRVSVRDAARTLSVALAIGAAAASGASVRPE